MACFPVSLIDFATNEDKSTSSVGKYNSIVRLSRLPRIYKLLRFVRIMRILGKYRNSEYFVNIQDFIQVNSRIFKLLKFVFSVCFCVHIMGCFWFLASKIDGFHPDTWVVRSNYIDSDVGTQYIAAIYWAFTTVTTVGFGDIVARTNLEMFLAMFWMLIGVGFYSYTIGSLSSFLCMTDSKE